ncbi:hypothetical protein CRYUN_Cryun10bG0025900 [Craigia yunnanensis]
MFLHLSHLHLYTKAQKKGLHQETLFQKTGMQMLLSLPSYSDLAAYVFVIISHVSVL